jgi:Tfp pilus assembly protein PilF/peptidoglycan hydrolase-like protein with peptidoglycan-binding domain
VRPLQFVSFKSLGGALALGGCMLLICALPVLSTSSQDDAIRNIQEMLIWTGDYQGVVTGQLNSRTRNAIKSFQTRLGDTNPGGLLTDAQKSILQSRGSQARDKTGFHVIGDPITGIRIGIPFNIVATAAKKQIVDGIVNAIWKSADGRLTINALQFPDGRGIDAVYQAFKSQDRPTPDYDRPISDGWFVLSGKNKDGSDYYLRVQQQGQSARGFLVTSIGDGFKSLVIAMSSSFEPFPSADTARTPTPAPAEDRKTCSNPNGAASFNDSVAACNRLLYQPNPPLPFIYYNLGVVNQQQDQFDDAIDEYTESLNSDKEYPPAYVSRAFCYLYFGKWTLALSDSSTAIRLYEKVPHEEKQKTAAFDNRGYAYAQLGNLDAALQDLNAALALTPNYARALNHRGLVYRRQGKLDSALDDLAHAIGLDPQYAAAYTNRGLIYESKGDIPRAQSDYESALRASSATPDRKWAQDTANAQLAAIRVRSMPMTPPVTVFVAPTAPVVPPQSATVSAAPKAPAAPVVPPQSAKVSVAPPVPPAPTPPKPSDEQQSSLEWLRLSIKHGILTGVVAMRRILAGQSNEPAPVGSQ